MKKGRLLTLVGSICLVLVLAASALMAACAAPAPEAPLTPAEFYGKNEVLAVTNQSLGGGTDFTTRILASYWPNFVEGGRMMVKNLPGGGGIPGVNEVWNAKPDGLTILVTVSNSCLVPVYLFETEGAEYDIGEFNYLADLGLEETTFVVPVDSPYDSIEDMKGATGFRFSITGPTGYQIVGSVLLEEVLGLKDPKMVAGYSGSQDIMLALQRGEVDGAVYVPSRAADWVAQGIIKEPLVFFSSKRSAWYPDVPTLSEVVEITPDGAPLLKIIQGLMGSKTVLAPPGVPQDRVDFMRDIFMTMLHDEAVVEQLMMKWAIWPEPRSGEEFQEYIHSLTAIPREDIELAKGMIAKYAK